MIPLQLTLKNFLSYREANLDFSGLHTACICGANGAGKSSLLEAITWAIWGKSRATSEDDAIAHGASDMRVDFTFQLHGQIYRIIRGRQRGGSGTLELQVMSGQSFKSLTQKGIKSTQLLIDEYLKIDYDTFTNSAYLRQGKADEFMLKKPSERKQILADLLKLDRYEVLADRAKQVAAEYKVQVLAIEQQFAQDLERLEQLPHLTLERDSIQQAIDLLQASQTADQESLDRLKATAQQRETYQQQIQWAEQRQQELAKDLEQLQQDLGRNAAEITTLSMLLERGSEIAQAYAAYERCTAAVTAWEDKARAHQQLQTQIQTQELQWERQQQQTQLAISQLEQAITTLQQQQKDLNDQLATAPEVSAALAQLQVKREQLQQLDDAHRQSSGLLKRRQEIQTHLDKLGAQYQAKLEQLRQSIHQLQQRQGERSIWQTKLETVTAAMVALDKQRTYLDRIRDKGQDCAAKLTQVKTQREGYLQQQQKLAAKLVPLENSTDAHCPLCSHPLRGEHWEHFLATHDQEVTDISQQIESLQEKELHLTHERDQLRQEYQKISQELIAYEKLSEEKGQISSRIATLDTEQIDLQQVQAEYQELEITLSGRRYGIEFWTEIQELDELLQAINYDDKTHALARTEVDRYRWAEVRQSDLKKAEVDLDRLQQQQLERQAQLTLKQQSREHAKIQAQAQIQQMQSDLLAIGYDPQQQQQDQSRLRQSLEAPAEYRQWQQAQIQHPQILARGKDLQAQQLSKQASYQQTLTDIAEIAQRLAALPDDSQQLATLEQQMLERRQQIDIYIGTLGQLSEKIQQLHQLEANLQEQQTKLQDYKQQQLIHDELTKAFGKNGIQALIVENILPQVEAEANHILARLSNNQFHIQFVTQKHKKKDMRSKKVTLKNIKPIDTLDILIGDANGTRPYENYSGGEAFRINFSIRLALAKLLSQRAGTPLQMLVVDEGFGTQDSEGCDRLIAAIDAISSDFACVLAVTHMPQFKEAFQTRIEVYKTPAGSQIEVFS